MVPIKVAAFSHFRLNTRAELPTSKWKPSFADALALINMYQTTRPTYSFIVRTLCQSAASRVRFASYHSRTLYPPSITFSLSLSLLFLLLFHSLMPSLRGSRFLRVICVKKKFDYFSKRVERKWASVTKGRTR